MVERHGRDARAYTSKQTVPRLGCAPLGITLNKQAAG
jgi:hypothetical protein